MTPAAWLFGYKICPPAVSLTLTVSPLPLSVAKPIVQPALIAVVGGKVTVRELVGVL